MPDDEFLTVAEIAAQLKVNQQTIRNWIDRGELGAIRVGSRRVRVPAAELERFIAESAAARTPSESKARAAFDEALQAAVTAANSEAEAAALRNLAKAAATLARAIPR